MPASRTVSVHLDPVANFAVAHFAADLAPDWAVALAGDHVPAVAQIEEPLAVLLSRLQRVRLPHRALVVARLPGLDLCRALEARAKRLRVVPMAVLSRDELGPLVYYLRRAKATRVPCLPRALPLLRPVVARRACLFHAQLVAAIGLTKGPLSYPALPDPLCRLEEAYPLDRDLHPLDLSLEPGLGCPPREQQHELAAEYSSDLPL